MTEAEVAKAFHDTFLKGQMNDDLMVAFARGLKQHVASPLSWDNPGDYAEVITFEFSDKSKLVYRYSFKMSITGLRCNIAEGSECEIVK